MGSFPMHLLMMHCLALARGDPAMNHRIRRRKVDARYMLAYPVSAIIVGKLCNDIYVKFEPPKQSTKALTRLTGSRFDSFRLHQ
jgi:hypothetical protein